MKKQLFILSICFSLSACLTNSLPKATVDISAAFATDRDVLYLDATGYGKTKRKAISNAQQAIYERILLTGIPNTPLENALLLRSSKAEQEAYLTTFIEEKEYERYTLLMEAIQPFDRKKRSLIYRYKINLKALRNDLQKQNITRPFGV